MDQKDQDMVQEDLINLLDKLMRENNLVSQEFSTNEIYMKGIFE